MGTRSQWFQIISELAFLCSCVCVCACACAYLCVFPQQGLLDVLELAGVWSAKGAACRPCDARLNLSALLQRVWDGTVAIFEWMVCKAGPGAFV